MATNNLTAKNYSKLGIALFLSVWAILAIIFGIYDLDISQTIANVESAFGHWFEAYGQLPGMIFAFLGGNVLLSLRKKESNAKNTIISLLIAIWTWFMGFAFWMDSMGVQVSQDFSVAPIAAGLGLVTLIIMRVIFRYIPEDTLRKLERPSLVVFLLSFLATFVTIWAFKIMWGRVTFRELAPDFSNFTAWYQPQGNNGHHSFPSGHTSFGWLVLPITMLAAQAKPSRWILWGIVIVWGVLCAMSRVVIGAHFASDVLFGACFTITWFAILNATIKPKEIDA